jgi:3-phosphoshikimate 1-carboxyvinyltransferase
MTTSSHPPARYLAHPGGSIEGELTVPGDKSISHRALMFGGIAEGDTEITGFLAGEDCLSTLRALQAMGVRIDRPEEQLAHGSSDRAASEGIPSGDGRVLVHGVGPDGLQPSAAALDMGNAGTAIRLFMGLLAPQRFDSTLIGDDSLMRRPMERVAGPLRSMGANIKTLEGRPPVEIGGSSGMRAIDYALPVASAQVKSCVMLAALIADGTTRITEPAPSRDHTERMLVRAGVPVTREGAVLAVTNTDELELETIDVPGDLSSAAFLIAAGVLVKGSRLLVRDTGVNWTRTGFLRILDRMGGIAVADLEEPAPLGPVVAEEPVTDIDVAYGPLVGTVVEAEEVPLAIDELPLVALLGCFAEGETIVRGAGELRLKESDRIAAIVDGLNGLGGDLEATGDGFVVRGTGGLRGGTIASLGDHRIAMVGAIAGLASSDGVEVVGMDAAAVSYPGFAADLERLV